MTTLVECPFCHSSHDPNQTGGYCDSCGRRLPQSAAYTTSQKKQRILRETDEPAGPRSKHPTVQTLLTAAVLRLITGGGFLVLGPAVLRQVPTFFLPAVMGVTILGAALFALAGLVAYRAALLAALSALGLFIIIWAIILISFPMAWPLAAVDGILLLWLGRAVLIARSE
ncbi:MAG: hypothetical protein SNJ82_01655 [Gemmataceae bacterium]